MKRRELVSKPIVRLMLDSGAFSAYAKGQSIERATYAEFLLSKLHLLDSYFNLDVIPGIRGQRNTPEHLRESAELSRQNFIYFRKRGLSPIPVFHQGESFDFLRQMFRDVADDENPYLALATDKQLPLTENRQWLDFCFSLLTDHVGKPLVKIHGLGIVPFDFFHRYPWFSIDSTTWALTAAFGYIFMPRYSDGVPQYGEAPIKITVSHNDRDNGLPKDHYLRMGPFVRSKLDIFLKQVGIPLADVVGDYKARARAVSFVYERFRESMVPLPFRHRVNTHPLIRFSDVDGVLFGTPRIVFATWALADYQGEALTEMGVLDRLISFWEVRDKPAWVLPEYVREGSINKTTKKMMKETK